MELEELSSEIEQEINKSDLLDKIIKNSKSNADFVEVKGIRYKRYNYVMSLIKQYRGFKCQFCGITIPKKMVDFILKLAILNQKPQKGMIV